MKYDVRIQQENRKSLAMKVTPRGMVALIPKGLDVDSPQVRTFIRAGLQKLDAPQPFAPSERFTGEDLKGLVAAWSERIGVQIRRVQIRAMRTKWASCSSNGILTLSADLLRLPRYLVDYVICHELVHLKTPNHRKGFQALMGCYMPDWQERKHSLASWIVESSQP